MVSVMADEMVYLDWDGESSWELVSSNRGWCVRRELWEQYEAANRLLGELDQRIMDEGRVAS